MNYIHDITVFLTGSIASSGIRALWDYFLKKEDFNREIRKMVYMKKLEKKE
jgi:hypothetical protein